MHAFARSARRSWKQFFSCAFSVVAASSPGVLWASGAGHVGGVRGGRAARVASVGALLTIAQEQGSRRREPLYTAIVLLGQSLDPGGIPPGTLVSRVEAAAEAYKQFHGASIIVPSGGDPAHTGVTEAAVARRLLVESHGVPAESIREEGLAMNTVQNAVYSLRILQELGTRHVVLVTSDFHMPRSLYTFEAVFDSQAATGAPSLIPRPARGGCRLGPDAPPGAPINEQSLVQRLSGERVIIAAQLNQEVLPVDMDGVVIPSPGPARIQKALDEVEAMLAVAKAEARRAGVAS